MLTGLAWALRETPGPAATPAAPAVSFRKSRRVAFDGAGLAMNFPLCETWMDDPAPGAGVSSRAARLVQPVFFFELPRQVGLGQVAEVLVGERVELVLEAGREHPLDLLLPGLLLKPAVLGQLLGPADVLV